MTSGSRSILLICLTCTLSNALPGIPGDFNAKAGLMASCLAAKGPNSKPMFVTKSTNPRIYEELNVQWNTRHHIQPLGILTPTSAAEVSNAIRCAKQHSIRVVAKSGGHSYEKYSYGNSSTIVIDLIKMNHIQVNQGSRTADVGGGVILSHLYYAIWHKGKLGLGGGTCVCVGAAHSLGAGFGYLSKRFGVTLDNVLEMDLVDANGELRTANKLTNPDLFWALRGAGGGNFGIVTRIKYQLFDASDYVFTQITFVYRDMSMFHKVFQEWDKWNFANVDGNAYSLFAARPDHFYVTITDAGLSAVDIANILLTFPEGETVSVTQMNFIELVVEGSFPHVEESRLPFVKREDQPRSPFRAKSYFSSRTLQPFEIDQLSKTLTRVPDLAYVQFSGYGGAINRVPSNSTAFVHRNSLYNVQVCIDAPDSYLVQEWLKDFDKTAMGTFDNGESYQNYVDGSLDNYLARYYGTNLPRLMSIKKKEDPTNFFNFPQSIPVI